MKHLIPVALFGLLGLLSCAYRPPVGPNGGQHLSFYCEKSLAYCRYIAGKSCPQGWETESVTSHAGIALTPHREPGQEWLDDEFYDHEEQGRMYFTLNVNCMNGPRGKY